MKWRRWWWALAALPLVVPLVAQETQPPADKPAPAESTSAESAPADDKPEQPSDAPPERADEHISADNSLTFPVDI
jgi:hypothetical protein